MIRLRDFLRAWDKDGGLRSIAEGAFQRALAVAQEPGLLQWRHGEVKSFILSVFSTGMLAVPPWQDSVWYDLYRRIEGGSEIQGLRLQEALAFAKLCFEETLKALFRLKELAKVKGLLDAEQAPQPQPMILVYASGVKVNLADFAALLQSTSSANAIHRARILEQLEAGELSKTAVGLFRQLDKDRSGALTWNNGEIRSFIQAVFQHFGLVPPEEQALYNMYTLFDANRSYSLDEKECVDMVDAFIRATFFAEATSVKSPKSPASSTSPNSYNLPLSMTVRPAAPSLSARLNSPAPLRTVHNSASPASHASTPVVLSARSTSVMRSSSGSRPASLTARPGSVLRGR